MLTEKALIVDIKDDVAWVETQRKNSCSACSAQKGCGTSVLQKVLGNKRNILRVNNPGGYSKGDQVMLGLQEHALVKGSLLLYALPLFSMFIFAFIGYLLFELYDANYSEAYSILFSFIGLITGFWYVALSSKKMSENSDFQARILEKIEHVVTIRSKHEEV